MSPGFWQDKGVLITGHTGFKGAWLSLWLQLAGSRVCGYSLAPPTSPNLFESAGIQEGMQSEIGDIRDLEHLTETIRRYRPEIVFHMAAQSLVRYGYQNPIETFDVNVLGTARLLEAVRLTKGVRVVVVVTSDKCYQTSEDSRAYQETDVLGGNDPYSSSKACAELVTAAYRSSYFNVVSSHGPVLASVRAGNVIGGGDWARDRLLPDMMRAIIDGRPLAVRNPRAVRPWQHVFEPLRGYLMLAERLCRERAEFAEAWNFGPFEEDAKPVEMLVQRLVELWGNGASWSLDSSQHPQETRVLKLDCEKARRHLGWKPLWQLDKALEVTVAWYKAYLMGQDVRQIAIDQLELYQTLAIEAA